MPSNAARISRWSVTGWRSVRAAVSWSRSIAFERWRDLQPLRPLRAQVQDELGPEPGCERLVEPQVVPPRHGHVVAEPHVRDLVRGDAREPLLEHRGHLVRAREQVARAVRDEAGVLHRRPEGRRRIREEVELRKGKGHAEEPFRGREDRARVRGGVLRLGRTCPSARRSRWASCSVPAWPPSTTSNSPTANATRYDGSGGERWNATSRHPGSAARSVSTGMFANARIDAGMVSVSFHVALRSGSSKQGRTRRASCGSNCVTAYQRASSSWRKRPIVPLRVHRAGEAQRDAHLADRQHLREREADHVVAAGNDGGRDGFAAAARPRRCASRIDSPFAFSHTRSVGSRTRTLMSTLPPNASSAGLTRRCAS